MYVFYYLDLDFDGSLTLAALGAFGASIWIAVVVSTYSSKPPGLATHLKFSHPACGRDAFFFEKDRRQMSCQFVSKM